MVKLSARDEAKDRVVAARAIVCCYQKEIFPVYEGILATSLQLSNAMGLGIYNLLQSKRQQLQAQRDYQAALCDYWQARIDLDRAVGGKLLLALNHFKHEARGSQE